MISRCILTVLLFCCTNSFSQNLDLRLLNSIHGSRNQSWDGAMNVISFTTYPVSLAVPITQFAYGIANRDQKSIENSLMSATALAVNTVIVYSMKYTIRRDRPYIAHPQYTPYEQDESPSLPSGHTSFAFTTATDLSIQYPKWYVIAPAYLWAGTIGYSRIHLGAHYPSDVLVGAVVGVASSYISYHGNRWLKGYWRKKTEQKFLD